MCIMRFVIELYKLACGTLMNGGKLPSGGFVRARYAGWRCGASIQRLRHSAIAWPLLLELCRVKRPSIEGAAGGLGLGERCPTGSRLHSSCRGLTVCEMA
jgi:hypothetical protein